MKWRWRGKEHERPSVWHASVDALVFPGAALAQKTTEDVSRERSPRNSPREQYLEQLAVEGAAFIEDVDVSIGWNQLYRLLEDQEHASSTPWLGLPSIADWVPHIETSGSPSDDDFSVLISGWWSSRHGYCRGSRTGGILEINDDRYLLAEAVWKLCEEVESSGWQEQREEQAVRLARVGRIQRLAKAAGARLDDYLQKTPVVFSDKLEIELRRADVIGIPVVEVVPKPSGAPDEFVSAFDRYDSVRSRYDVPGKGGALSHVVPAPAVSAVLSTIKSWPGRRLASDDARLFAHNPYAVLGEEAYRALDEESLIEERRRAGLLPYRMRFRGSGKTARVELFQAAGEEETIVHELTTKLAQQILAVAGGARSKRFPLFNWNGFEVELGPKTDLALAEIGSWLLQASIPADAVRLEEIFDLDAYSDRVVGFKEAAPQIVPYVKRSDSDSGWFPENAEYGFARIDPVTGEVAIRDLGAQQRAELRSRVEAAERAGLSSVELAGLGSPIGLPVAKQLLGELDKAEITIGAKRSPVAGKEPRDKARHATLEILHNIEHLDYASSEVVWGADTSNAKAELPAALRPATRLLPHQLSGLAWLQHRYRAQPEGVTGCLLADDMGLGKTLQALCLMAWHAEHSTAAQPCLVVAPVSLLENWRQEVVRFLAWDEEDVLSLYGAGLSAYRLSKDSIDEELIGVGVRKLLANGFESGRKLVLTTYETLRDYEFSLARVHWGVVVCDEAQKIKNPAAFVTQAAKALRADFRIACTGTPVENSLADLWCLFDFFQPGFLRSLNDFTRDFRKPIESGDERRDKLVKELRSAINPWVLRRMKTEVHQGLPKKIEDGSGLSGTALGMSQLQASMYKQAIDDYHDACSSASSGGRGGILQLLHKLRLICASPLSLAGAPEREHSLSDHLEASPKLDWLLRRLAMVRERGEKAIVFTEYRDMQRLLRRAILERLGYAAEIINGSTSVNPVAAGSRQRLIDRFQEQEGFGVIILSTSAVGFGVNIQAANHVIHFTRPWNPAKEDQATDRAYRIGQTRDVFVDYPTVVGKGFESFEQRLGSLLSDKRQLSADMLMGIQEISGDDFLDIV